MISMPRRCSAAALVLVLAAAACENDTVNRPFGFTPIDPLFERYVSMGNSITAGYQSDGINDSLQAQSYAVLLAAAMRSPFFPPLMRRPGCPHPIDSLFVVDTVTGSPTRGLPHRIGNTFRPDLCALRLIPPGAPPYISNTAVPGAAVIDIYNNLDIVDPDASANELTMFFLGGLTQVQMARRADPTFMTVWIGNNDVLGAAVTGGDTTMITPAATFTQRYGAMLDSIDTGASPQGGVLIGVANVTLIPFFSLGATYFGLKAANQLPPTFTVSPNCAPSGSLPGARGDSVLVPFPYGAERLAISQAGGPANLDCADSVAAVVVPAELRALVAAVTAYNATVSAAATARGWAYLDPNALFGTLPPGAIPLFPNTQGPDAVSRPFGDYFSRDGVHPTALTHRLLANALATLINAEYGTNIPPIP